jgi:hypothetical protein
MILAMPSWRRRRMTDTWSRLRGVLAEHGLSLREKGQDLAMFGTTGWVPTPIEISDMHEDLSRAQLAKRLGAFELPDRVPVAITVYDKFQAPKREEEKRERVDGRRDLRVR